MQNKKQKENVMTDAEELSRQNERMKSILATIINDSDICWVCEKMYGVDLPKCKCMNKTECYKVFMERIEK